MLGTGDWETAWYRSHQHIDLFGASGEIGQRTATVDVIQDFVGQRLQGLFPKVLAPMRLRNDRNFPMFSLFFAISNPSPKAIGLAAKIARSILKSRVGSASRRKSFR